jgi:putative ABC transport system substrate-binding protein
VQRLRELGWIDGRAVAIEYRWAEGRNERVTEIAARAAKGQCHPHALGRACNRCKAGDIDYSDRVRSRRRPGRHRARHESGATGRQVTGLSVQQTDIAGKRLELLWELVHLTPATSRPPK